MSRAMHTMKEAMVGPYAKERQAQQKQQQQPIRDVRHLQDPQGMIYPNSNGKMNIPIPLHMFSSFTAPPPLPTVHPGSYPASQSLSQGSFYGWFFC